MENLDMTLKIIVSCLAILSTILSIISTMKVKKLEKQLNSSISGKKNNTITSGDSSNNVIGSDNKIRTGDKD